MGTFSANVTENFSFSGQKAKFQVLFGSFWANGLNSGFDLIFRADWEPCNFTAAAVVATGAGAAPCAPSMSGAGWLGLSGHHVCQSDGITMLVHLLIIPEVSGIVGWVAALKCGSSICWSDIWTRNEGPLFLGRTQGYAHAGIEQMVSELVMSCYSPP